MIYILINIQSNCDISFDKYQQPFAFYPNKKLINIDFENKHIESFQAHFGVEYYKYPILHEYGHFLYNKKIKDIFIIINNLLSQNIFYGIDIDLLNKYNQIVDQHFSLKEEKKNYYYLERQQLAADEFFADFFVLKTIHTHLNNLNSETYIKWRMDTISKHYDTIINNYNLFETIDLSYYHIPFVVNDLKKTDNDFYFLIKKSIEKLALRNIVWNY